MPSYVPIFFLHEQAAAPLQALTQQTPSSPSVQGIYLPCTQYGSPCAFRRHLRRRFFPHPSPPPRQQLMIYSLPPPSRLDLIFAISSRGKTISPLTPSHPSQQHVFSPCLPPPLLLSPFLLSRPTNVCFQMEGGGRGILGRGRNRKEGEGGSSSAPNGRWRLDVNWKAMLPASPPISLPSPFHPIPLLMTGPVACVREEGDGGELRSIFRYTE